MEKIKGYGAQSINQFDIESVSRVLKSGFLTQGPAVKSFEEKISEYVGSKYSICVSNGTAALHLCVLALGIGPGDAVIVPAMTFAATANSVLYSGAKVIFADINSSNWGLDIQSTKRALVLGRSQGLNVKAVLPVHYAGLPVDISGISKFAKKENLYVIEDACHALGAKYRISEFDAFEMVGSGSFSNLSVFSFHPVKHITTGEGGAITTNDKVLCDRIQKLRSHGITKQELEFKNRSLAFDVDSGLVNPWYMEMQSLGLNYRMSDLQAVLGESQLCRAEQFLANRIKIADFYRSKFDGHSNVKLQQQSDKLSTHAFHLFPLAINYSAIGSSRYEIMKLLKNRGVPSQVHYLPVYFHPYYAENCHRWYKVDCPNTERLYNDQLSIPMYQDLTLEQAGHVSNEILSLLQ